MYLSKHIEELVSEFSKLPGVGKKTAFRYVLHCINSADSYTNKLSQALSELKANIQFCDKCNTPNDNSRCEICRNPRRNQDLICVVESYKDLIAIENTNQYFGVFHILGGVISPIDGIGPEKLNIENLVDRLRERETCELIMALNPTIEGDTTIYYLSNVLKNLPVKITTISRGIAFGGELDYTDELTLSRSIQSRQPYEKLINK
jgi:recombination protein RecR